MESGRSEGGRSRAAGGLAGAPLVVLVVGGPGSGRAAVMEHGMQSFGFASLSAASLLSAEIRRHSEIGRMCETILNQGRRVPVEVTLNLLRKALFKADGPVAATGKVLVDSLALGTLTLAQARPFFPVALPACSQRIQGAAPFFEG